MRPSPVLLTVASILGVSRACDLETLQGQITGLETTCCDGQNCDDGLPDVCDEACAPVFIEFYDDCGSYLQFMPNTDSFGAFYQQCEMADPGDAGEAGESCDTGALLTVVFFQCSGIDQNNANAFCNTDCSRGVGSFLSRCAGTYDENTAGVFQQAQTWISQCANDATQTAACHASVCGGDSEATCSEAFDRESCDAMTNMDSSVFCRWQPCDGGTMPPAPPPVVPGCMDPDALNYDPLATFQTDGSCLYGGLGPIEPVPGQGCSASQPYFCTNLDCESQWVTGDGSSPDDTNLQWVPCENTPYGQSCSGDPSDGQCTRPCTPSQPENCYTQIACAAAGINDDGSVSGDGTQWYTPQPDGNNQGNARCERACSASNKYNCHTQEDCEAVGQQWHPPTTYPGSDFINPGYCEAPCSEQSTYTCRTEASCTGVGKQWVPDTCCGDGCGVVGDGAETGNCQDNCSPDNNWACHNQVDCEAIGRQWVPNTDPGCGSTGSCNNPCTTDNYYNCNTRRSCEALGLEWHDEVQHTADDGTPTYLQPGRCSYTCSLMSPDNCDTQEECDGIGFAWIPYEYTNPSDTVTGYCSSPCSQDNTQGCLDQRTCEQAGNVWVVEEMQYCGDYGCDCMDWGCDGGGGYIDPGFGGGGDDIIIGRRMQTVHLGQRKLEDIYPGFGQPNTTTYAHCEQTCDTSRLWQCRSDADCTGIGAQWNPNTYGGDPETDGYCSSGCAVNSPYECDTEEACLGIGGEWDEQDWGTPPDNMFCNVTLANCDINMFLAVCSSSVSTGEGGSFTLCDDACGRFIRDNYDRCSDSPPQGMTGAQWQEHFGPIRAMCDSLESDPEMSQCMSNADEAATAMTNVCCSNGEDCAANGGAPSQCSGECADLFLPFFETCGPMLMIDSSQTTSLGAFYETCTASGVKGLQDPALCRDNNGKSPFTAMEFRSDCQIWVKYTEANITESPDFVQLVSVGGVSYLELEDVAREVCGQTHMVERLAEDMSGILALSNIKEHNKMWIVVNHPITGNERVHVTNSVANKNAVRNMWQLGYSVEQFDPNECPHTQHYGR